MNVRNLHLDLFPAWLCPSFAAVLERLNAQARRAVEHTGDNGRTIVIFDDKRLRSRAAAGTIRPAVRQLVSHIEDNKGETE